MNVWGVVNHVIAYIVIHHAQPEDTHELLRKLLEDLQTISEELAEYINSPSWNRPAFYDDKDEYSIQYKEYFENSSNAIAPVLPTEEPGYSLSMGDEHLSTILKMESDEVIKSSVENLVPIPSEFEVTSDNESECDVPVCDDFTTFSNPLFDSDDNFSSSDNESFSVEDEFFGELAYIDLVSPEINKANFDPEEEIRLIEEMLYDNSSPRPPKESNSEISDATIESLSLSISYLRIKNDDYELEGDIHFLEELLSDDPFLLPKNESSNFDHHDDPSFPRPPPEPRMLRFSLI
nr:hypothetical protein [Tanacetum cinerariifolium]